MIIDLIRKNVIEIFLGKLLAFFIQLDLLRVEEVCNFIAATVTTLKLLYGFLQLSTETFLLILGYERTEVVAQQ